MLFLAHFLELASNEDHVCGAAPSMEERVGSHLQALSHQNMTVSHIQLGSNVKVPEDIVVNIVLDFVTIPPEPGTVYLAKPFLYFATHTGVCCLFVG